MDVVVSLEHRFARTPDGTMWTQTMNSYSFWSRYLDVFEHVFVVARVLDVPTVPGDSQRANGEGVSFIAIPHYIGPWQYILKSGEIRNIINREISEKMAVIMRMPSQIGQVFSAELQQRKQPYSVEVVGDPYDVFSPGANKHPLRPFFRWQFTRRLKQQCRKAMAASYVTEHALQRRYPVSQGRFSTYYSDVELPKNVFASVARDYQKVITPVRLVTVGSLAHMFKAPDILISAVTICVNKGFDLHLTIVGDGKHRPELEKQVQSVGMEQHITFLGQLQAGDAIRVELDQADLFILPSRQEGLPRAMIEAMARALPCIGSTVGGIPELLRDEDMVLPGDARALAGKIIEVVTNPARMTAMSEHNLDTSRSYHEDKLRARRIEFYQYIRDKTEEWLSEKQR